jgi:hypothetical protein
MSSNWGIPMVLQHFGPFFKELHQFGFFFQKIQSEMFSNVGSY